MTQAAAAVPLRVWQVNVGGAASAVDGIATAVGQTADDLRALGCQVEVLAHGRAARKASWSRDIVLRLRDPRRRPNVVHLHSVFRPAHALVAALCLILHVPYVLSPHSGLSRPGRARQAFRKRLYIRVVERPVLRHASAVVCLTALEAVEVRDVLGDGARTRCVVIPNAVAVGPERERSPRDDRPLMLTLARFDTRQKGLDRLAGMAERCPDLEFTVHGQPDRNEPEQLARLRASAPVNLHLRAPVFGKDKDQVLLDAHIYVQPSRWEGLSLALLEAMMAGLPCAVSTYIGRSLPIEESKIGLVLDDDVDVAAEQLTALVVDTEQQARLGSAASSWVRDHCNPERVAQALVAEYRTLCSGG